MKQRLLLAMVFAFGAVGVAHCSVTVTDDGDASDAHEDLCLMAVPDAAEFSCDPVLLDAAACNGPPSLCKTCDASLAYPLNCSVKLPFSSGYCHPVTCDCLGYWKCSL